MITKGERRENKRRKLKRMKVNGAGVRNLQQIIIDKGNRASKKEKNNGSISSES